MALNREEDRSNSPMDSHRKAQQQYYQRHCALNEARETGLEVAHNLISELESSLAESRRKLRWAEKHQDDVIEERVRDRVLAELEVAEYHHRRAKRQLEYRYGISRRLLRFVGVGIDVMATMRFCDAMHHGLRIGITLSLKACPRSLNACERSSCTSKR